MFSLAANVIAGATISLPAGARARRPCLQTPLARRINTPSPNFARDFSKHLIWLGDFFEQ
jgi:hypothetical protein